MRKTVELWFDFSCPYAYLGFTQIEAVAARTQAEVDLRPMLLGGVFRARDVPDNLAASLSPEKARHNANDLRRFAQLWDVPLDMPAAHPIRTVTALRALLAVGPPFMPLARALFRAYWVEGVDVSNEAELARVLVRADYDAPTILARAKSDEIKGELRSRTDEAIARGIFGAPSMFVDDRLYWGQDRLDEVELALGGAPTRLSAFDASRANAHGRATLYFDYACPFSAVALKQARHWFGPRLDLQPVSLRRLLIATLGAPSVPTLSPAKIEWRRSDLLDRADECGLWIELGPGDVCATEESTDLALGLTEVVRAGATGRELDLVEGLFEARWSRGEALDQPEVLLAVCHSLGLDGELLLDTARSVLGEGRLEAAVAEAQARGVFGLPSCVLDGEARGEAIYFGADRVELAARAARGEERAW